MDSIHLYMDSTHLHPVVYQCLYIYVETKTEIETKIISKLKLK